MRRLLTFLLLAIVSMTFAQTQSTHILQATKIRENSISISWQEIPGAVSYKVMYDELELVNIDAPEPLLTLPDIQNTTAEVINLVNKTSYYFVVEGYDMTGEMVGKTLPLHAQTYATIDFTMDTPTMIDDKTLSLRFSRPIDIKNTQIDVVNTETQKTRTIDTIETSSDDLRVVLVRLAGKMALGAPHDVIPKKVTAGGGLILPLDQARSYTVTWTGESTDTTIAPSDTLLPGDAIGDDLDLDLDEPTVVTSEGSIDPADELTEDLLDPLPVVVEDEDRDDMLDQDILKADTDTDEVQTDTDRDSVKTLDAPVDTDTLPRTGATQMILLLVAIAGGFILSRKVSLLR